MEESLVPSSSVNADPPRSKFKFSPPVEPVLFVIFFTIALTESTSTSILLSRTCSIILGLNETNCTGVLAPRIEKEAQYYVSDIILAKSLIEAIVPGLLSLFVGAWSDVNGRKPFMMSTLLGFLTSVVLWLFLISRPDASPYYFILTSVPIAFSGGVMAVFTCVFSYLSDYCDQHNRAFRMTMANCSLLLAIVIGYFVSTEMYLRFSDVAVNYMFIIAAVALFLTFLYVVFILPETVDVTQGGRTFFNVKNVKEIFGTVFLERPNKTRPVIFLLMWMSAISIMVFNGEASFRFLSLRDMFAWTPSKYNLFFMVACILSTFAAFLTVYILKSLLHLGEVCICTIVSLLAVLSAVLTGLSTTNFAFMVSINIGCLSTLLNPMIKSELAKIIHKSDMGKVYAFMSTLESLSPLLAAPAYKFLYDRVLDVMPFAIFFLSATFWGIIALLSITVLIMRALNGIYYTTLLEEPLTDPSISTVPA